MCKLIGKYEIPDLTPNQDLDIPQWQKDLLDERIKAIEAHPEVVKPIEELVKVLHRDVD